MEAANAIRRAQVYKFLCDAFVYPRDNWTEDIPALEAILKDLGLGDVQLAAFDRQTSTVVQLQSAHRRALGLTGSLCYETECGLPDAYRQAQEMADIAGFYRAFGFAVGGAVRERPDHLAVELEFMHLLALKEAYALEQNLIEHAEICSEAQRKFLQDHLGCWLDLFAKNLALNGSAGPYPTLAQFTAAFVAADAARLGAQPARRAADQIQLTPFDPDPSCAGCTFAKQPA